jgi:hypothetical protein
VADYAGLALFGVCAVAGEIDQHRVLGLAPKHKASDLAQDRCLGGLLVNKHGYVLEVETAALGIGQIRGHVAGVAGRVAQRLESRVLKGPHPHQQRQALGLGPGRNLRHGQQYHKRRDPDRDPPGGSFAEARLGGAGGFFRDA